MPRVRPFLLRAAFALLAVAKIAAADGASPREQGLPFIELFDSRDYRGHAQIWAGVADARGLLYFGNYGQILVYDGVQWDRIAVPGATFVRALAFDARGRLWVGAVGAVGYVDTVTATAPVFVSLADRLPAAAHGPGAIASVLVFGDSVYFQSQAWLFRWRDNAFEGWSLPSFGPPSQSMVVAGEVVIQNSLQGWRRIGPRGLEPAAALPALPPTRFTFPLPGGRQLFGTIFNGLFVSDGRVTRPFPTEADDRFRTQFLFNGLPLPDGRLAFTLLTGGAVILGPDLSFQALIDDATGLPSSTVNNAFTDQHGGLWLCLGDGIARVADTFAATWFRPPTPFGRIDGDALTRFHGRLFLGVAPELRRLEPPAQGMGAAHWEIQTLLGSRQGGRISALLPADNTLLIAAADGVYAWTEEGSAERLVMRRDTFALLASVAQPGRFFVAHAGGIDTLRHTAGRWIAEGALAGLESDVRSLHEDAAGALWAGLANGGVARLTFPATGAAPAVEVLHLPDKLPPNSDAPRVVAAGGRPLFVTARGLFRFDVTGKTFTPETAYGRRFTDGSTRVSALTEDARGDLWIAPQPVGSATWPAPTLGRATRAGAWHPLAVPDLARIGDILGLRLERTGEREILWAVGASGLLRVELDALRTPPNAGATLVRAVTPLDDTTSLPRDGAVAVLPYAKNSLRFRVAAPGLSALSDVQFATELTGLGQGAHHVSPSPEREFTHLPEGRYVFRARARANAGEWTAPAEFAFTILPPWWREPWAWALWGLVAAGGIFGIVARRTRVLRQRTALLENTVADRTLELHARNHELARLHRLELDEKISARLAEEKTRLELLRYQLNPHFLFNTLNSLYSLVEEHPTAGHMVLRLSEFCRLTLTRGARDAQPLGDELHMLAAYLDIEKVRWGDSLRVALDVEDAARAVPIPPFLLLPLVENAIKHGSQTSPDVLQLRLAARLAADGALEIEIANTGHWLVPGTSPAPSTHIGLENLRERLARSYAAGAHTFEHEASDGWVRVRLRLKR